MIANFPHKSLELSPHIKTYLRGCENQQSLSLKARKKSQKSERFDFDVEWAETVRLWRLQNTKGQNP